MRLVGRCWRIEWLKDGAPEDLPPPPEVTESPVAMTAGEDQGFVQCGVEVAGSGTAATARHFLRQPHLPAASLSNLSVMEVASQKEKPGVQMPSRHAEEEKSSLSARENTDLTQEAVKQRRPSKQGPPVAPRRKGRRKVESGDSTNTAA